jgi:hypothetical protein
MHDEGSCGPRWMVLSLGEFGNSRPFQSCSSLVRNSLSPTGSAGMAWTVVSICQFRLRTMRIVNVLIGLCSEGHQATDMR